ncbi:hypothetical protein [Caballeronia sp. M23-90]
MTVSGEQLKQFPSAGPTQDADLLYTSQSGSEAATPASQLAAYANAKVNPANLPYRNALSGTEKISLLQSGSLVYATVTDLATTNATRETFVAGSGFTPGTTTSITLAGTYGSINNIGVYFDDARQFDCSLSGNALTFNPVVPVGIQAITIVGGSARTIGVPSASTVGDQQLTWGNVLNRGVDSIAALQALNPAVYTRAFATGYYAPGDGGGGAYWYSATSTATVNNGTIIASLTGVGRWLLGYQTSVVPEQFGALGNGTGNDAPAINAALMAVGVVTPRPSSTYRITQPIMVPYGAVLEGPGKGLFTGVRYQTFGTQGWYHPQGVSAIAVDFGGGSTNEANSAVQLAAQATVQGISFYYPSQSAATLTPTLYPPTIALTPGTQSNVSSQTVTTPSVVSCHFANPYRAISFSQIHNSGFVSQCTGYAYDNFAYFDNSYDTNRMENCQINEVYSYYGDFPATSMLAYQYATTTSECVRVGHADAMEISNVYSFGFYKGLSFNVFNTGSPNGIFVNGGGWEGCFFPVIMATQFRRITLRGVQLGSQPLGVSGGGPSVTVGVPTNTGITSEVRLIGCTSFSSVQAAVSLSNVNGVTVEACEWYNSNQTNAGFVTGVFQISGCNTVKVIGNHIEQNSSNPNGQYFNVGNSSGVIVTNNTYTGQQLVNSNLFFNSCTAVRCSNNIEQLVNHSIVGTGVVFNACTQATSDNYIQY